MQKILLAVLLALGALQAFAQSPTWPYPVDNSQPQNADSAYMGPKVATSSYAFQPGDRVVVVDASAGAIITLPACNRPGQIYRIINASWPLLAGGQAANVISAQPLGSDTWVMPPPAGSSGNFPIEIDSGKVTWFAEVSVSGTCGWAWFQ